MSCYLWSLVSLLVLHAQAACRGRCRGCQCRHIAGEGPNRLLYSQLGQLSQEEELKDRQMDEHDAHGLHCLVLDTSIFSKRKHELHRVALQASNIEDLTEVIRTSLTVICKQWSDATHTLHEKFDSLSTLIIDHGLDSSPQEEFLSLLGGARTSPPIHQFLVNSLGEAGVKLASKAVCGDGKELQLIILDHLLGLSGN